MYICKKKNSDCQKEKYSPFQNTGGRNCANKVSQNYKVMLHRVITIDDSCVSFFKERKTIGSNVIDVSVFHLKLHLTSTYHFFFGENTV